SAAAPAGIYPDSDIEPAGVLARLVLASVLEGSPERARIELGLLRLLYPDATGHIASRDGRFVDLLIDICDESMKWAPKKQSLDWPTLGGDMLRTKAANIVGDVPLKPLWSYPLPRLSSDRESIGAGR